MPTNTPAGSHSDLALRDGKPEWRSTPAHHRRTGPTAIDSPRIASEEGGIYIGRPTAAASPERRTAIMSASRPSQLIALELVPEADRVAGAALTAAGLLAGTLVYVAANTSTTGRRGSSFIAVASRLPQTPGSSRSPGRAARRDQSRWL